MNANEENIWLCEVSCEYSVVHEHERLHSKSGRGIRLAVYNQSKLIGQRAPVQFEHGAIRRPLDPSG